MSTIGRNIVTELKNGNYAIVDQHPDLQEMDIKMVNHYAHELFAKAIDGNDRHLLEALLRIPGIAVSSGAYCALRHAVKKGISEILPQLIAAPHVKPNLPEPSGDTAIILAVTGKWAEKKGLEMIQQLVRMRGIKVDFRGDNKQTALMHAITKRWYKVAQLLMEQGANPKVYDASGSSPLSVAMMATDLPSDLFMSMLTYQEEMPVEEVIAQLEAEEPDTSLQPYDDPYDILVQTQQMQQQGGGSQHDDDDQDDTDDDDPTPTYQTQAQKNHHLDDEPAYTPAVKQAGPQMDTHAAIASPPSQLEKVAYDEGSFLSTLGEADMTALERVVTRAFLMRSPGNADKWLLHKPEVLAGMEEICRILELRGDTITSQHAAEKDPMTGDNLWMAAARNGLFAEVLLALSNSGCLPRVDDLLAQDLNGKSALTLIEQHGELNEVLHSAAWAKEPGRLAKLLAVFPKNKRQAYKRLVTRTHIMMLDKMMNA